MHAMEDALQDAAPELPHDFNLADYFLFARLREGRAGKVAIITDHERITYGECAERTARLASRLIAAGVGMEDRVLIALPDVPEFAYAFFAVLHAGAVVTMVNPELPDDDYAYYVDYTRARAIVIDAPLLARIAPALAASRHLRAVFVRGAAATLALPPALAGRVFVLADEIAAGDPACAAAPTSKDDVAVWLFTSGSTGKPKGAVHMHHDFAWNTERYAKQVLRMTEADITCGVPKLFFGYATGTNLMFPFAVGATAVLFPERSTPERLFDVIERHQPTMLTSVPTTIAKMLAADPEGRRKLGSLRVTLSAGEALPEELYTRWKQTYGVEILDGIGSAEMFHIYISNRFDDVTPGSLGKLVPGYQARIVGPDGAELPDGEVGTLHIRGDSAALCYWGAHEQSKQTLRGDWVVTGDQFRRDGEGRFWYAGRADDMLKVGGIWVSPQEVENVLLGHAAVLECVVLGYEEAGLTLPRAVVVVRAGGQAGDALAAELIDHARSKLAHYKAPRRIEFATELPRSDRGKVLRRTLK